MHLWTDMHTSAPGNRQAPGHLQDAANGNLLKPGRRALPRNTLPIPHTHGSSPSHHSPCSLVPPVSVPRPTLSTAATFSRRRDKPTSSGLYKVRTRKHGFPKDPTAFVVPTLCLSFCSHGFQKRGSEGHFISRAIVQGKIHIPTFSGREGKETGMK